MIYGSRFRLISFTRFFFIQDFLAFCVNLLPAPLSRQIRVPHLPVIKNISSRFCWKPLTSCQSSEFAVSKLTHWLVHGRTSQCIGTGGGGYPLSGAIHPYTTLDSEFDETSNSLLSRTTSIRGHFAKKTAGRICSGAEKPASDDAGTGKRLEPETGFCASKITVNL